MANKVTALVAEALAAGLEGRPRPPAPARLFPVIFFADNSRLWPDAHKVRGNVEAECKENGVVAEWPSEHAFFPTSLSIAQREQVDIPIDDQAPGRLLGRAWRKIGECDAMVAEVTPFHGVHLNPLVAFEIGVATVFELPIFAWTTEVCVSTKNGLRPLDLARRVNPNGESIGPDGNRRDADADLVENFGLVDWAQIARQFVSVCTSRAEAIRRCAHFLAAQRGLPAKP